MARTPGASHNEPSIAPGSIHFPDGHFLGERSGRGRPWLDGCAGGIAFSLSRSSAGSFPSACAFGAVVHAKRAASYSNKGYPTGGDSSSTEGTALARSPAPFDGKRLLEPSVLQPA